MPWVQVLNQIVYPVLKQYQGMKGLKDSRLLELTPPTEHIPSEVGSEQNASLLAERSYMLAWLPLFETFALWCLLLFPGELLSTLQLQTCTSKTVLMP